MKPMEKKRINSQIVVAVILLALVLAFLGLVIRNQTYGWRAQRRLDRAAVELQSTTVHSQGDLEAAVDAVKQHISVDWALDLERIWYDPAQAGPLERELLAQDGTLRPEDVVVLFVDYRDVVNQGQAGGGTEETLRMEYRYDLMRDETGCWYVFSTSALHGADVATTPTPTPIKEGNEP